MSQLLFQPLLAAALGRAHASLFVYCSQASEDASITVDKGTNACTVIKIARAAAQKVRKVLKEKEDNSQRIGKQVNDMYMHVILSYLLCFSIVLT